MNVKKILVANLVISSLALATGGVALGITTLDTNAAEQVVCKCTCPVESVEEVTEPTVETIETEPVEVTEPTELTEVTEATEAVKEVEAVEVAEVNQTVDTNYLGEFKLTAYCACSKCCGQWANGITATGTVATQGRTIAVDPSKIPYGTKVSINGHTYVAEDCGGAIKGNRIDVYFDSHSEALQFGVQYADVYIVGS